MKHLVRLPIAPRASHAMHNLTMTNRPTFRIGSGAGFQGDRLEPAVILASQGELDYLGLECLVVDAQLQALEVGLVALGIAQQQQAVDALPSGTDRQTVTAALDQHQRAIAASGALVAVVLEP